MKKSNKRYKVKENIYQDEDINIYRAEDVIEHKEVVIKELVNENPSQLLIDRATNEYLIEKKLANEGVATPLPTEYIHEDRQLAIVFDETENEISLKEWLNGKTLTVRKFLNLAVGLVVIVKKIHACGVIHKDLKPTNILIDKKNKEIKITGFGYATELPYEVSEMQPQFQYGAKLSYASPEQCDNINRIVDFRTDFYSLGVIFYEILVGQLPFLMKDEAKAARYHIAVKPKVLTELNPKIPVVISNIIMKLLAKYAEDRYQSDEGLLTDLNLCLENIDNLNKLNDYKVGAHDEPKVWRATEKNLARQDELKNILDLFYLTAKSKNQLLLIKGTTGVGKKKLVYEAKKLLFGKKLFFIQGRCDEYCENAYRPIAFAFQDFVNQLNYKSPEEREKIAQECDDALSLNARLMLDIAPELKKILNDKCKVEEAPPAESLNRLLFAFEKFMSVIASINHPLVLFIEDLHWADQATLRLLEKLAISEEVGCCFLIFTGDKEKLASNEAVVSFFNALRKVKKINNIELHSMDNEEIEGFITESFKHDLNDERELIEFLKINAGGNQFFIGRLLSYLFREKIIIFNAEHSEWKTDKNKLLSIEVRSDIDLLLSLDYEKFDEKVKKFLKYAALLGFEFDVGLLAKAMGRSLGKTFDMLNLAVTREFICPLNRQHDKLLQQENLLENVTKTEKTKFCHIIIRDFIISKISDDEKAIIHKKIADAMYEDISADSSYEDVKKMLYHFNKVEPNIKVKSKRVDLAELNIRISKKDFADNSYDTAFEYAKKALAFLGENSWQANYVFAKKTYTLLSGSALYKGDEELGLKYLQEMLGSINDKLDKSEAMLIAIYYFYTITDLPRLKNSIREALLLINIKIPRYVSFLTVLTEYFKCRKKLTLFKEMLFAEKIGQDTREERIFMKIWAVYSLQAHKSGKVYEVMYTVFKVISASPTGVLVKVNFTVLVAYGIMLLSFSKFDEAHKILLSIDKILNQFDEEMLRKSQIKTAIYSYDAHLNQNWRYLSRGMLNAANISSYAGSSNFTYTMQAVSIFWDMQTSYKIKANKIEKVIAAAQKDHQYTPVYIGVCFDIIFQGMSAVERDGVSQFEDVIKSKYESGYLDQYELYISMFWYNLSHLILCVHFDILETAEPYVKQIKKLFFSTTKRPPEVLGKFYLFIFYARNYHNVNFFKKMQYRFAMNSILRYFDKWAEYNKENFLHQKLFLMAELDRMNNKIISALRLYGKAISLAKESRFLEHEAIYNESLGALMLEIGNKKSASFYLYAALLYWQKRKADRKVHYLQNRYAGELEMYYKLYQHEKSLQIEINATKAKETSGSMSLDASSIIKLTNIISRSVELKNLISSLLRSVLENSGADFSALILVKNNQLYIEGEMAANTEANDLLASKAVTKNRLPMSVINSVEHEGKFILLDDALNSKQYATDYYVERKRPKSILCLPITRQDRLEGILYLENKVSTNVFTPARVELVQILSSQAAISIEIARSYGAISRFVPTEFLTVLGNKNIVDVNLGDCKYQQVTVLFNDIRQFTKLSLKLGADNAFKFLNKYFFYMEPVIKRNHGFITKYLGDAILAIFPNHPDDALLAAIELQQELRVFNQENKIDGNDIYSGSSLSTGKVLLGTLGESGHMDVAAIGKEVDIAQELEDLNPKYGTTTLMTEATYQNLLNPAHYITRKIDEVSLLGAKEKTAIYEVLSGMSARGTLKITNINQIYQEGLDALLNGDKAQARKFFEQCLTVYPEDSVTQYMLKHRLGVK